MIYGEILKFIRKKMDKGCEQAMESKRTLNDKLILKKLSSIIIQINKNEKKNKLHLKIKEKKSLKVIPLNAGVETVKWLTAYVAIDINFVVNKLEESFKSLKNIQFPLHSNSPKKFTLRN